MKVLVLSDVHGNFEALESVIKESRQFNWKELWFLGDISGYGPEPDKCFRLLSTFKLVFIPGNHDLYYAGRLSRDFFSREALGALILTGSKIKADFKQILKEIPVIQKRRGITLVHGSVMNPEREYILFEDDARRNFDSFKGSCCLFGHTHRQGFFVKEEDEIRWVKPEIGEIVSYKKNRLLVNPGSVGQPRDKDPRAGWAILDTTKKELQFFRTEYNIEETVKKMKALGSSDYLLRRLETGS
ncbi:MAG: metallophosphoesterase family protein [Spirochaetaceae bacterium]|nr:metallophosphoesterase family protein [Spirochaetaceae bacterium]